MQVVPLKTAPEIVTSAALEVPAKEFTVIRMVLVAETGVNEPDQTKIPSVLSGVVLSNGIRPVPVTAVIGKTTVCNVSGMMA